MDLEGRTVEGGPDVSIRKRLHERVAIVPGTTSMGIRVF